MPQLLRHLIHSDFKCHKTRRFAGRMEDGTPSVSDPAFGQASAT